MDNNIYALKRTALIFSVVSFMASLKFINFEGINLGGLGINVAAAAFISWFLFAGAIYCTVYFSILALQHYLQELKPLITQEIDFSKQLAALTSAIKIASDDLGTYQNQIDKRITEYNRKHENTLQELQRTVEELTENFPTDEAGLKPIPYIPELDPSECNATFIVNNSDTRRQLIDNLNHGFFDILNGMAQNLTRTSKDLTRSATELSKAFVRCCQIRRTRSSVWPI